MVQVAYKLVLPLGLLGVNPMFHVSVLKWYHRDEDFIIKWDLVLLNKDLTYEEHLNTIFDWDVIKLRKNKIRLVKVQ